MRLVAFFGGVPVAFVVGVGVGVLAWVWGVLVGVGVWLGVVVVAVFGLGLGVLVGVVWGGVHSYIVLCGVQNVKGGCGVN